MLVAENLHLALGTQPVLRGMSIRLAVGEVVAVLGANGAGKSSLLEVLAGSRTADAGTVRLDDLALEAWRRDALARRRAVLPQRSALSFHLSVLEVVLLGRSPYAGRSSGARDLAIAGAALEETGTSHLAARSYPSLSGGERQRVQLARVLAQLEFGADDSGPAGRYLLLDEPTSALDPRFQQAALDTARRVAALGAGVLAVIHDVNLAAMHADRLYLLASGRVLREGSPERVLIDDSLRDAFGVETLVTRHPRRACPLVITL